MPSIDVRLAALNRDTARLEQRAKQVAAALPAIPNGAAPVRTREAVQQVAPLFEQSAQLGARAVSIVRQIERGATHGLADGSAGLVDARLGAQTVITRALYSGRTITQLTGLGVHDHAEVAVSRVPGSPSSKPRWEQSRGGQDLPNVRLNGSISPVAANLVTDRLENVPARVVTQTDAQGARAIMFSGNLTDVWGYRSLKGVQPRGWPEGSTWDIVPGAGSPEGFAANPGREQTGRGHGSTSLALHEYGHVVDHAMASHSASRITSEQAWMRGPQREVRSRASATDYVTKYPEEWFAESFARYTKSRESQAALARWYPKTWEFLRERLGEQRFA